MTTRNVTESMIELSQLMLPIDANPSGNVHGGVIMKIVDEAGGIVAKRHARKRIVTASIDKIDFISPVFVGDLVIAKASINYAGTTSMEVGVRVEAEDLQSGKRTHVASAYITYVALDDKGKPSDVPELIPESDEEKRRLEEAKIRRELRLKTRKIHKHQR